jgi:L-fuconate dehydratase
MMRERSSPTITRVEVRDIRFPTSRSLDGSDAMNVDPDYSAAYVVLHTDAGDGPEGHGLTFTIGRGNELCVAAVEALAPFVLGHRLDAITGDMGTFWRSLVGDSQLRWVGPEKGVLHLATAAMVNAVWDLWAKVEGKPLWKLLADMTPEEIVRCIDFRYITDALTPEQALAILRRHAPTRGEREEELNRIGYPAYTTSAGWLGYSDEKIRRLCREGMAQGWSHFKIKVGGDLADDLRRAAIIRQEIGPDRKLMMDANQVWDVDEAIANMRELARFDPWWIEEPTSPDDVLGHATIARAIAPIGVATGEQCQNRVIFKQLMQADAIAFCQIDSCRLGGVNEVLAVLLLAARFGIPVCPHAGGVGLCEYVQHLAIFDYLCVSGSLENRIVEYVDHLHEHFLDPVVIRDGRYVPPTAPGYSITMRPESLREYAYPDGAAWVGVAGTPTAAGTSR